LQEILHVHVPHYVHMFHMIMEGPKPWRFGQLLLPGGSHSLGSPEYALRAHTRAPLTGTLVEILHCDHLPDGRLLILIGGLARFRVRPSRFFLLFFCPFAFSLLFCPVMSFSSSGFAPSFPFLPPVVPRPVLFSLLFWPVFSISSPYFDPSFPFFPPILPRLFHPFPLLFLPPFHPFLQFYPLNPFHPLLLLHPFPSLHRRLLNGFGG
jgi:hypothetical protein